MGLTRVEVVYDGHVQGVGFRATTRQIARRHAVTGWVRNEPDGTVRLVAEGERDELERFLREVRDRMAGHIRDERINWSRADGGFDSFDVRF